MEKLNSFCNKVHHPSKIIAMYAHQTTIEKIMTYCYFVMTNIHGSQMHRWVNHKTSSVLSENDCPMGRDSQLYQIPPPEKIKQHTTSPRILKVLAVNRLLSPLLANKSGNAHILSDIFFLRIVNCTSQTEQHNPKNLETHCIGTSLLVKKSKSAQRLQLALPFQPHFR